MAMSESQSPGLVRLARKYLLRRLFALVLTCCWVANAEVEGKEMILRGGVVTEAPYAMMVESPAGGPQFTGFVPEMLRRLEPFAAEDGYRLTVDLEIANKDTPEGAYGKAFDLVANDCNTTANPVPRARCEQFDLIAAAFYVNPVRAMRADLSPAFLRASITTIKAVKTDPAAQDFTTLAEAQDGGGVVCVQAGTMYPEMVAAKFSRVKLHQCDTFLGCLEDLRGGKCDLCASDDLTLRYTTLKDNTLEMIGELLRSQYLVMPLNHAMDITKSTLIKKWMYAAVADGTLDELYFDYFDAKICPLGKSGENCELNCDPKHGRSDKSGECVCDSSKWTGDDCSVEVVENLNLIPTPLKIVGLVFFCINAAACFICAIWLHSKRDAKQVKAAQPFFLKLVLLGCLISSSTILVMLQENSGGGPVHSCAAIPWLYSIGFSVTFGTLFAKIWRVYRLFAASAQLQQLTITVNEAILHICAITSVDVIICTIWTIVSPLEWKRTVTSQDQFGEPLGSQGYCHSDHWPVFAGIMAAWHLILLLVACVLCYKSRHITTLFSEGKYLAMVMMSNLQIFVISIPVLMIVGAQSASSFFVRAGVIWINDLCVLVIIFGHLMYSVHIKVTEDTTLGAAMNTFASTRTSLGASNHDSFGSTNGNRSTTALRMSNQDSGLGTAQASMRDSRASNQGSTASIQVSEVDQKPSKE